MTKIDSGSRAQISMFDPLFIDCFAGGGGYSKGAELALGRSLSIAINHDPDAVLMHRTNHPFTQHECEDIWHVVPLEVTKGQHVALIHFSPDCTHFSRAKGGTPVKKKIRGLAWVILWWAATVKPDVITFENVPEFRKWGRLVAKRDPKTGRCYKIVGYSEKGKPILEVAKKGERVPVENQQLVPDKKQEGKTFKRFVNLIKQLGYEVEFKNLKACDYGAATSRERMFGIFRRDNKQIVWPEPTHGDPKSEDVISGRLIPWKTAAEVINWDNECPSIFASKDEIRREYGLNAVRPLADNTMRRVIRGVNRFLINDSNPFVMPLTDHLRKNLDLAASSIVEVNHQGDFRGQNMYRPLNIITEKHGYGVTESKMTPYVISNNENAAGSSFDSPIGTTTTGGRQLLVSPMMTALGHTGAANNRCRSIKDQVHTTVSKAESCLVASNLIEYHSEITENQVRGRKLTDPITTLDTANRVGLVSAALTEYYGSNDHGQSVNKPAHTATSKDREGLISASLLHFHGASKEKSLDELIPTTECSKHEGLAVPFMSKYFSGGYKGAGVRMDGLVPTTTAVDHNALVNTGVVHYTKDADIAGNSGQRTLIVQMPAEMEQYNWPRVRALLNDYCGYTLGADEVLLINVNGLWYFIADIGLRMLTPRELYNANGFPEDYIIDYDYLGNEYGKTKQVARCGNAVPPPFATAIVRANLAEYCGPKLTRVSELHDLIAV